LYKVDLSIAEIEQRRQANQASYHRPPVQDKDFVELAAEFETPTMEENLLVYDEIQPTLEWIKDHIHCDAS
jgi:hypothetical protein